MGRTGIWFITFNFAHSEDAEHWNALHQLHIACTKIIRSLKRSATQMGKQLEHARVYGMTTSRSSIPNKFHVHALLTWLPDTLSAATPAHPHRYHCPKLEKWAKKHGLTVWIEKAESAAAVANYCANNVRALGGESLPSRFRRFHYSRKWYPWTKTIQNQAKAYGAGLVRHSHKKRKSMFVPLSIHI